MKFVKITILLLLASLTMQNDWEKYLTNINIEKEPIQEEWVTPCVTGYKECSYKGESATWCDGKFNFLIVNNEIKPADGIASGNIRSYRIPKGWEVEFKGIFAKKFFSHISDQAVVSQISKIQEGSLREVHKNQSDQICPTAHPFWRLNVDITSSKYVQITKFMPEFLSALIKSQTSRYQQGNYGRKLNSCKDESTSLLEEIRTIESAILTLERQKEDLSFQIQQLKTKIEQYTQILNGIIKPSEWLKENEHNKEELNRLKLEQKNAEAKLADINAKINSLNIKISEQNKIKIELETSKTSLNKELQDVTVSLNAENLVLRQQETEQSVRISRYTEIANANKNLEREKESINENIRVLKESIAAKEREIERNNCSLVKMEDDIGKNYDKENLQKGRINTLIAQKEKIEGTIKETINRITTIVTQIDIDNQQIIVLNREVSDVTTIIGGSRVSIEKFNNNAIELSKQNIRNEIAKFNTELLEKQTQLTGIDSQLSLKKTELTKKKTQYDERQICTQENLRQKTVHSTQFKVSKDEVENVFMKIKNIYGESMTSLRAAIDLINDSTPVTQWIAEAKRNMHIYLDTLPAYPAIYVDVSDFSKRRKRRMRRMRRRLI
jgi:myosin heavy subunit